MIDEKQLLDRLSARFGQGITVAPAEGAAMTTVRLSSLPPPNGFQLVLTSGWRSIEATFAPDAFSSRLMKTLGADDPNRRSEFAALAATFADAGVTCSLRIDQRAMSTSELLPGPWAKVDLSCMVLSDKTDEQRDAEMVVSAALALILALLPLETEDAEVSSLGQGLPEGALQRVAVNRYERSISNRAAAIAIHGTFCQACGFDFFKFYGPLGDGFIEVHHRVPVSQLGDMYRINPAKDLIPLCANCHQMVHRSDPPLAPEELRTILLSRGVLPVQ